jgi:hypothetical protein
VELKHLIQTRVSFENANLARTNSTMAEALPPEVERMASFGRALEGTVDITQEDIDEVPSDEGSPSASRDTIY